MKRTLQFDEKIWVPLKMQILISGQPTEFFSSKKIVKSMQVSIRSNRPIQLRFPCNSSFNFYAIYRLREKKTRLSYKTILAILSSECNCYFKMCHFFFPFFPFVAKFVRHWKIGLSESKCLKYLLLVLLRTFFRPFFLHSKRRV